MIRHLSTAAASLAALLLFNQPRATGAEPLFADRIVAKGKGVEVKYSKVEDTLISYKASRAAAGQPVPPGLEKDLELSIVDRLIATQILTNQATTADITSAKVISEKFISEAKAKASSEESFNRQIRAGGLTPEQFHAQVQEQSLVKAVIDRELKTKHVISDEQVKKFYEEHPEEFQMPDQLRVTHILFSFKDPVTKADLSEGQLAEKRKKADEILARAKKGEDFAALIKEFSDDRSPDHPNGEYTFSKGQMPPEFEVAAFTLSTNQVSDLVTTRYGNHIIKLHEKIGAKKAELGPLTEKVRDSLQQEAVQKDLPSLIEKLRKEADVVVTLEEKKP